MLQFAKLTLQTTTSFIQSGAGVLQCAHLLPGQPVSGRVKETGFMYSITLQDFTEFALPQERNN